MSLKLFVSSILLLAAVSQTSYAATDKVVCFYATWAVYRNGAGACKPVHIDPTLCTHINYAFLGVGSDGTLQLIDEWNDINLGGLEGVASLKNKNKDLKVLVSIGGWNAGNGILSGVVASKELRKNLIDSSIEFYKKWNFDGLDISWEYPTDAEKKNFVVLLQEMQEAYAADGYVITVTASADPRSAYDIPEITKVVDLVNLMTYDFHGAYDGITGYNSPLYNLPGDQSQLDVNSSVSNWLEAGMESEKLTFSIPLYGHSYTLNDPSSTDVGAPANAGIAGPYTQSPGILGYNEICSLTQDWERKFDDVAKVPYKVDSSNWVSYDDEESVGIKVKYAIDLKLAGVSVWSVDTDDFLGVCDSQFPLLKAINTNLKK